MLRELVKKRTSSHDYPFNVISFEHLSLDAPVVFFTGENGSGKSTLLRAVGELTQSINVGKTPDSHYHFDEGYSISWSQKLKKGYYFQSEDFYSFLLWADQEATSNQEMLESAINRHSSKESIGYLLETNLHRGNAQSMHNIVKAYKHASHGEGYIRFFNSKLRSNTLYLLDEPETPLSFQNQLSLIALIDEYVKKGSQFIICTHSPVLLAYPNAKLYLFDSTIHEVTYDMHPLVQQYREFLASPERYMHYLLEE